MMMMMLLLSCRRVKWVLRLHIRRSTDGEREGRRWERRLGVPLRVGFSIAFAGCWAGRCFG